MLEGRRVLKTPNPANVYALRALFIGNLFSEIMSLFTPRPPGVEVPEQALNDICGKRILFPILEEGKKTLRWE